jgi:hypothetical protein
MSYEHTQRDYCPGQQNMVEQKRQYLHAEQEALKKQAYMREMAANQIRGAGAIAGAGAIGRDALVSRAAGLEYQMERLAKTVATNEEVFNQLMLRLTPFVRPLPIQEQEKRTHTNDDSQSPLADQVSRIADQLDRINRGMTYLIDGVDL